VNELAAQDFMLSREYLTSAVQSVLATMSVKASDEAVLEAVADTFDAVLPEGYEWFGDEPGPSGVAGVIRAANPRAAVRVTCWEDGGHVDRLADAIVGAAAMAVITPPSSS
jgi:hypothetical protein